MKLSKLHLSPYGIFEHPEGKQNISFADAQRCIRQTRTLRFRLGLTTIPVYVGHPDDPLFQKEHSDERIYGYVKDLCADEDGLWVFVKWTKEGRKLMPRSPHRYLSPRWVLSKTETQTAYHPECLLSVGLTQHPNLPVQPITFDELPKQTSELRNLLQLPIINRFFMKKQTASETSCPQNHFRGICIGSPFGRLYTGGIHLWHIGAQSIYRLYVVFAELMRRLKTLFTRPKTQTTPSCLQSKLNVHHTRNPFKFICRAFIKKNRTSDQHSNPCQTSDKSDFSGGRSPFSSDLHGTQTREEKQRILQFGQTVRARMEATGESYPEAWNFVSRQPSLSIANIPSKNTNNDLLNEIQPTGKTRRWLPEKHSEQKNHTTSCAKRTVTANAVIGMRTFYRSNMHN